MVLYYYCKEIYVDFQSITESLPAIPQSRIYRRIVKSHFKSIKYRNRTLYNYRDLVIGFPEFAKIKYNHENEKEKNTEV